jgi:hypothetical protein
VRPAGGENDVALGRELFEADIAIDMQHALEVLKMRYRALGLSIRREQVDGRRRLGSGPWPLLARIDPDLDHVPEEGRAFHLTGKVVELDIGELRDTIDRQEHN